ncbi:MAG: nitroreductase family protein, partial [Desulfobacterales bacterium]|nr:nitroreductase family protein [Desulfobacterales bacterium]
MNPVLELLAGHRSIRKFTSTPVDDAVVEELLSVAQYASTSSHIQAYSVIWVKNTDTRREIAELAGPQKWVETAPVFLVFCADLLRLESACEKHNLNAEMGWAEQGLIATTDVAMLGQNMMIAAESIGLGGVFIGGIRNDPSKVSTLLDLPDQVYPAFGLC